MMSKFLEKLGKK